MSKSQIKTHVFPNGFRVIYEPPYNSMNISDIRVYCRIGSEHESEGIRGVSHYIEHMCFKGTTHLHTSSDISIIFDSVGAYLNGTTDKQYTYYSVYTHNKNTPKCLHVLSDMMLNSVFDEKECKKELNVVVEENVKNSFSPSDIIFENLDEILYKDTKYEFPVDTLAYHRPKEHLTRNKMFKIYREYYVPHNMVLSIVSSLPFSKIIRILEKSYFTRGHTSYQPSLNNRLPPHIRDNSDYVLKISKEHGTKATRMCIGFCTVTQFDEDDVAISYILKNILSGTFMSRMFSLLREKHGLTYSSSSDDYFYNNIGSFVLEVITDVEKLLHDGKRKGVLEVLIDMLNDLVEKGVTEKELKYIKGFIEGNIGIHSEKSNAQCEYNAYQYFMLNKESIIPYNRRFMDIYDKIGKKEINTFIRKYFTKNNMYVCIHGSNLPPEKDIRRVLSTFR
jgi:predicted Zn-dependent peptidase